MKIIRKDGIEYERVKVKNLHYDKKLCFKFDAEQIEKARKKADELNISLSELVRRGVDLMIEKKVELNENDK